jgi:uncharacterized protein YndB with AHSA1/START domain
MRGGLKMARNYTIQTKILRPVADVFDAVVSSERLGHYFVNGASGDLTEGAEVIWRWDHYGENTVVVRKIVQNELVELALDSREWEKTTSEAYEVLVIFEFEQLEDGTMLSISEQGWKTDAEGLKGSHDNCGGWSSMAMCLKAYIEYGIDLR